MAKTLPLTVGALLFRAELYEGGIAALDPILAAWDDPDDVRYVGLLVYRAKFAFRTLDIRGATPLFRRALRAAERIGDPIGMMEGHVFLGSLANTRFGMARARRRYLIRVEEAVRIAEAHGLSAYHLARVRFNYAIALYDGERWDTTLEQARLSLQYAREADSPEATAIALTLVLEIEYRKGNFEAAVPEMEAALRACEWYGDAYRVFWAVKNLGEAHLDFGDPADALVYLRRARALAYRVQNVYYSVVTGLLLALALTLADGQEEAKRYFRETREELAAPDYVVVGEERFLFLCALAVLAADPCVRCDAWRALGPASAGQPRMPAARRREHLRVAAGIDDAEGVGRLDGIDARTLFREEGPLEPNA